MTKMRGSLGIDVFVSVFWFVSHVIRLVFLMAVNGNVSTFVMFHNVNDMS